MQSVLRARILSRTRFEQAGVACEAILAPGSVAARDPVKRQAPGARALPTLRQAGIRAAKRRLSLTTAYA